MLRLDWLLLVFALAGVLGGAAFSLAELQAAANATWIGVTAVAFITLVIRIARALLRKDVGVDVIALLAIVGSLLLGEYLAGAVIGLMLASGQLLESHASARARRDLTSLLARAPRRANRIEGGRLVSVDVAEIEPGDLVLVKSADVLPVDGVLVGSSAVLDRSALTGESRPVEEAPGARLESGTVNVGAPFRMRAAATAASSAYAGVIRLVEAAQRERAPVTRLADRYAALFIPFTLLFSGAAWIVSGEPVRALAVLVVATPCPLLLAVPIAIVAGLSRMARRGIITKGGAALEALARSELLFLDKTGTVTAGTPTLAETSTLNASWDPTELLRLAAAIDQVSSHVLAVALVRAALVKGIALPVPASAREEAGAGVEGVVEGRRVRVGTYDWVTEGAAAEHALELRYRAARTPGATVFVAVDGALAGTLSFEDPIRVETPRTLRALRRSGIREITLLTGDQPIVARSVAAALAIDRVLAGQSPAEKVEAVRSGRARGKTAMAGDGINDAPALAAADLGIAMGARGATASSEAADIVLTADRFDRLVDAVQIAQRSRSIAAQSALVGISLSIVAMGVAFAGYLTPVAGAFLQEGIDVLAIASALRSLAPGRKERRRARDRRVLGTDLAERLRSENQRLAPALERLRNLADQMDTLPPAQIRGDLLEIRRFLTAEMLEHERFEELEVYPAISARMQGEDPLAGLSRTHQEIFHLVRALDLLVRDLPDQGPEPRDATDIRRLLYGLHAVWRLHFAQEEELYQRVGDDDSAAA